MTTCAQIRANEKYDKENTIRMSFKFNKNTDADILEALEKSGNKQGFIKECIRKCLKGG